MAKQEISEATRQRLEQIGTADVVVGVPAVIHAEEFRRKVVAATAPLTSQGIRTVVVCPGSNPLGSESPSGTVEVQGALQFAEYLPAQVQQVSPGPIVELASAYRTLFSMADTLRAKICMAIAPDLLGLHPEVLSAFVTAIGEKQSDLAIAMYPFGKYEGLLNTSILAPLSRALYGRRVRYPLAADLAASSALLGRLSDTYGAQPLLWPVAEAAMAEGQVCQIHVNANHSSLTTGLDLSSVLSELVGSLFIQMESNAAWWQKTRGSHPAPVVGTLPQANGDGEMLNVQPMIESFLLGSRNLQDVWSLVLPPVTMLELKRLTRMPAAQFRMPDEVWARIIFDFALAHRLRTMNRGHLLGALLPLYLGWVASYASEVATVSTSAAEQRVEKLARAFEENKPYLVSRWRWPDRFNP